MSAADDALEDLIRWWITPYYFWAAGVSLLIGLAYGHGR